VSPIRTTRKGDRQVLSRLTELEIHHLRRLLVQPNKSIKAASSHSDEKHQTSTTLKAFAHTIGVAFDNRCILSLTIQGSFTLSSRCTSRVPCSRSLPSPPSPWPCPAIPPNLHLLGTLQLLQRLLRPTRPALLVRKRPSETLHLYSQIHSLLHPNQHRLLDVDLCDHKDHLCPYNYYHRQREDHHQLSPCHKHWNGNQGRNNGVLKSCPDSQKQFITSVETSSVTKSYPVTTVIYSTTVEKVYHTTTKKETRPYT
jgi:hypothetical protein